MSDETTTNPLRDATWEAALHRRFNTPLLPSRKPAPTGDPLLDLVDEWTKLAKSYPGPKESLDVLAMLYSREHEPVVAALSAPPLPTTMDGAIAALDLVLAEGVIIGEGVAVVRAVAEALRHGLPATTA